MNRKSKNTPVQEDEWIIFHGLIWSSTHFYAKEIGYKMVSRIEYLLHYDHNEIVFQGTQESCTRVLKDLKAS